MLDGALAQMVENLIAHRPRRVAKLPGLFQVRHVEIAYAPRQDFAVAAQLLLGRDAFPILQRDQVDQLLLGLLLAAGDVEPRLQAANCDIGVGRLRGDGEPCCRRCRSGRLPVGTRRVARGTLAAE